MNLMRWFRRNNSKIMLAVLLLALVGFVIGPILSKLGRGYEAPEQDFAVYDDGEKITNFDIINARQELELLRQLGADTLLNSISVTLTSAPNYTGCLVVVLKSVSPRASPGYPATLI